MSARHPIIAVTGSSGAGTSTVKTTFEWIFRREKIDAAIVEGDAFHRYDRAAMRKKMQEAEAAGNRHFSHFGPEANLFGDLEELFRSYALSGSGRSRTYVHDAEESAKYGVPPLPADFVQKHADKLVGNIGFGAAGCGFESSAWVEFGGRHTGLDLSGLVTYSKQPCHFHFEGLGQCYDFVVTHPPFARFDFGNNRTIQLDPERGQTP